VWNSTGDASVTPAARKAYGHAAKRSDLGRGQLMQLAPMRFTRISGTAVEVTVTSTVEAKAALKELRHKKRELKFLRSALLRRQKAARAKTARPKRRVSFFWRMLSAIGALFGALVEVATVARAERRAMNPAEIDRELQTTDELLHNLDGCILQIEGKLLARG
jgi:hypothetical protein